MEANVKQTYDIYAKISLTIDDEGGILNTSVILDKEIPQIKVGVKDAVLKHVSSSRLTGITTDVAIEVKRGISE